MMLVFGSATPWPEQLFVLTDAGKEGFPRHYPWFAQLLIEAITKEHGAAGLRVRLARIAAAVVAQLCMARAGHVCRFPFTPCG